MTSDTTNPHALITKLRDALKRALLDLHPVIHRSASHVVEEGLASANAWLDGREAKIYSFDTKTGTVFTDAGVYAPRVEGQMRSAEDWRKEICDATFIEQQLGHKEIEIWASRIQQDALASRKPEDGREVPKERGKEHWSSI
jgi:predicted transcriptional regulator